MYEDIRISLVSMWAQGNMFKACILRELINILLYVDKGISRVFMWTQSYVYKDDTTVGELRKILMYVDINNQSCLYVDIELHLEGCHCSRTKENLDV